jgi:hypothetical protein
MLSLGLLAMPSFGEILPKVTLESGEAITVVARALSKTETVAGKPSAARLSERTARMMQTFTLTQSNDTLLWTQQAYEATLPSGGYRRTMMTLTNPSATDIVLNRVFMADALELDTTKTYQRSGNTDGAVVLITSEADKNRVEWFAIEHPMAKYALVTETINAMASKQTYTVDDLVNQGISGPTYDGTNNNYYGSGIFWVPVEVTDTTLQVTLQYTSGNLKALYYKVEAFDLTQQLLLASDAHDGESGSNSSNNTYTLRGLTIGAKYS